MPNFGGQITCIMGDVQEANGMFVLFLGKGSPYIFSKFNLLYKDPPLIRTHGFSVSVLTVFDRAVPEFISFLLSFLSDHPTEE